jgi:RimJ/RimL family protein N-acetyltransferase
MTTFEIPMLETNRLRLRAFQASDLDAYASMQGNPEVLRRMVMGRAATRAEVWQTLDTLAAAPVAAAL